MAPSAMRVRSPTSSLVHGDPGAGIRSLPPRDCRTLGPRRALDIYVSVSSYGTLAGLIIGKALFQLDKIRIMGIRFLISWYSQRMCGTCPTDTCGVSPKSSAGEPPINLSDGLSATVRE